MRKGDYVKYIGPDPLGYVNQDPSGRGIVFKVEKRSYDKIRVYFYIRALGGKIIPCPMYLPVREFVKIKRG